MFELVKCKEKEAWNNFVRFSDTNNIFSETSFLDLIDLNYLTFIVCKKNKPVLGIVIFEESNIENPVHYSRSLYQGLVLDNYLNKPTNRSTNEYLNACEFMLDEISKKYNKICICLHPSLRDIRPFDWYVFKKSSNINISKDIFYTGVIKLDEYENFTEFFNLLPSTRKQEYKKILSQNLKSEKNGNINDFLELFNLTFKTQNIDLCNDYISKVEKVVKGCIKNDIGELNIIYTEDKIPISATFFVDDGITSNYLHGANNPNLRKYSGSTFLMINQIKKCFDNKFKFINLLGINSPTRAYFKTSFNAKVYPFFELTLKLR